MPPVPVVDTEFLFRIVDGKIMEHWANRDDLGIAKQIGLGLRPLDDTQSG